jgi:hypothetical protein
VLVSAALLLVPAPASVFAGATITYCGKLINSGSYCRGTNGVDTVTADTHSYSYNDATYSGGGSLSFCERAVNQGADPAHPAISYSFNCAALGTGAGVLGVSSGGDLAGNCSGNTLIDVYVYNNSGNQHTVYGHAKYGTGQGFPCNN